MQHTLALPNSPERSREPVPPEMNENAAHRYLTSRRRRGSSILLKAAGFQCFLFIIYAVLLRPSLMALPHAIAIEILVLGAVIMLLQPLGMASYTAGLDLVERGDDWWLAGVKGPELAAGLMSVASRRARLALLAAAFLCLVGGMIGFHAPPTRGTEPLSFLVNSLWAAGIALGLAVFAPSVGLPMTLVWITSLRNKLTQTTAGAATVAGAATAVTPGSGARLVWSAGTSLAILAGFLAPLGPPALCYWYSSQVYLSQRNMIESSIYEIAPLFLPTGFALGCLWGAWARLRRSAHTRALAERFDSVLEFQRLMEHESRT